MAKTAAKPKSKNLDSNVVYGGFSGLMLGLALAAGLMPPSFSGIFSGHWGLFENLTVVFLLLAAWFAAKAAWTRRKKGEKAWSPWAVLSLLALVLAGEEVGWLIPFLYDDYRSWPFTTLQGVVAQSFEGVPDGASLKVVAIIAGIRLGAILATIYGILAAYYYRKELQSLPQTIRKPETLYALGFIALAAIAALMHAGALPGRAVFGECIEMLAAAALLMSVSGKVR